MYNFAGLHWETSGSPSQSLAKQLRGRVRPAVKAEESKMIKAALAKYKTDPRRFWETINELMGTKTKNDTIIHLKISDGTDLLTQEMRSFINDFYGKVGVKLGRGFSHLPGDISMD